MLTVPIWGMFALSLFEFVILGAATWRITRLFNRDSGPGLLLERLRFRLGVRRGVDDEQLARDGSVARLVVCHDCFAFVPAVVFSAFVILEPERGIRIALPFAVWGLSILINNLMASFE